MSVSSIEKCKMIYIIMNSFRLASYYGEKNLEENIVCNFFLDVHTFRKVLEMIICHSKIFLLSTSARQALGPC
jgi:hypothetical protein